MTPDELRRLADEDWARLDRIEYDRDRLRGAADDWEADRKRLAEASGAILDAEWADDGCLCPFCGAFRPDIDGGKGHDPECIVLSLKQAEVPAATP